MKNQYFRVVKCINQDDYEVLTCIHIKRDQDVWDEIWDKYLDTFEYIEKANEDPYSTIYKSDIKEYLKCDFPDIYDLCKRSLTEDICDPNIKIWLATLNDYRKVDEQFDNEMSFLEYITSEVAEEDRHREITIDILKEAGFKDVTTPEMVKVIEEYGVEDYHKFRCCTDKKDGPKNCLKLDINNGLNNRRDSKWQLHIDNCDCCTIGFADIINVWEFNTLMQVFGSKFRL